MNLKQMALDAGGVGFTDPLVYCQRVIALDDESLQRFAQAVAEECAKAVEGEAIMYPEGREDDAYQSALDDGATTIRKLFREQV